MTASTLDSANVDVAVGGYVAFSPTGTTAPVDADTALAVDWLGVGYLSDDGVVETRERSTSNIVAWQNADVVRSVTTESSITVNFTMIETNENSIELYYGAAVDATTGSVFIVPADSGGRRSMIVQYIDGDKQVRLFIPEGEVTEVGDLTLASGEPVGYEVTITGYPSASLLDAQGRPASAQKWWSELAPAA